MSSAAAGLSSPGGNNNNGSDKEGKRRKQLKRMTKILASAWQASDAVFQQRNDSSKDDDTSNTTASAIIAVTCLADIGSKLDNKEYRLGRHGWEDFCKDLGGVYNWHHSSNSNSKTTKKKSSKQRAALAKETLDKILPLLPAESLQQIAASHVPSLAAMDGGAGAAGVKDSASASKQPLSKTNKKRPAASMSAASDQQDSATSTTTATNSPARKKNKTRELADREDRAMDLLRNFVVERGGSVRLVDGFSCRVTKKGASAYNVNFYSQVNRRFRSMLEVGRHFGLVDANTNSSATGTTTSHSNPHAKGGGSNTHSIRRRTASKESEAEKKRLRRELDRLRKVLKTASKALDAHTTSASTVVGDALDGTAAAAAAATDDTTTNTMDDSEPVDDYLLVIHHHDHITRLTCAAARRPDIYGFPLVAPHVIPDVLMAWDFLCTFSRPLSLTPIALDDFAAALVYTPPEGQLGDDVAAPPVYLAEAHLALLKLLLQDAYSDDWWWSTLETAEEELPQSLQYAIMDGEEGDAATGSGSGKAVIKVDMEALLSEPEDPLITASWVKSLEAAVVKQPKHHAVVKAAIKETLGIVSNKWVHAYLRKTLETSKAAASGGGDPRFMTRAVVFLIKSVTAARPDLVDRTARSEKLRKAKETVILEANEQMAKLNATAPAVTSEDALSDVEYDSEEDSDDEDDDADEVDGKKDPTKLADNPRKPSGDDKQDEDDSEKIASVIPPRPTPSIVDLLLPPTKPSPHSEYLNPFTWSTMVGATAHRVLHRKKRLLNEVDDYLRAQRELKPPSVAERREREKVAASRVLTECEENVNGVSPTERAIEHLCNGGHYLQLTTTERLCVLRLLVEAAYDTNHMYEVVNGNIKQRQSAMKALEVEQRRAKKEEKEKAIADIAAARDRLALEAKERFLDEKREEIRKLNERSKELSDDVIESLTEEDILDFDEDIKADFLALPTPDSFNKTEVKNMVSRMQEEAAFDCDSLRIMTMAELLERERRQLEEMEGQLLGFGGEEALADPHLDRETVRSIERLRKDIEKAAEQMEKLPAIRERAMDQLKDAMEDGTIKVLRAAITAAKKAKLSGPDEETGGVWALDLMRNAALELDRAKSNKRVMDAQRDLVSKRNKCFIRTEPMGLDRFSNRFWTFDNDEDGHFWVETEYVLDDGSTSGDSPEKGFIDLQRNGEQLAFGAKEYEEDFMSSSDHLDAEHFHLFSRREHHSAGFTPTLVKHHWGCQATEESLRAVIKLLNSQGIKEGALKTKLKESLEHTVGNDEKHDSADAVASEDVVMDNTEPAIGPTDGDTHAERLTGDSDVFKIAKDAATPLAQKGAMNSETLLFDVLEGLDSGIGQKVRVRQEIESGSKDQVVARYENGVVVAWKTLQEEVDVPKLGNGSDDDDDYDEDEEMQSEPKTVLLDVPYWKIATDRGHTIWLKGDALLQSICRFEKWTRGKGYFEDDAAFFSYRNHLGKYLGRAQEAPYSCSPNALASLMVRREGELYSKLKIRSYDNNWGGKSGARALWTNSMKDYAFDFQTVKQGLVTLENAFFELTGGFADYENISATEDPDAKALLQDPATRIDIELETIEKNVPGLWNSKAARLVFLEIVGSSKTTGILGLCLDLLCRNTTAYLRKHKLLNTKTEETFEADDYALFDDPSGNRRTRGLNLWQRQKKTVNYEEFF